MNILIKGGRVIDPKNKIDAVMDILLENGKISKIAKNITTKTETFIDAHGKIVAPGIVDMHVHLREPGREDKETVSSATAAAASAGVTTVLAMPNTHPAMDCAENINLLKKIISKSAKINVLICAAISRGRLGQELNDFVKLQKAGALAVSDDGSSVDSDVLMLAALKAAAKCRLLTICHCEDKSLSCFGVMNTGFNSTRLGLRGISKASEYKRIERDIKLAEKVKAAVHIAHLSCSESVEIVAKAKKRGVLVTCETAPHYFSLTEEALLDYDTNKKMNPPLRAPSDLLAIKQGLKDGTIDAIASDHAPHTENEKNIEFERAEFGVVGLETELAVGITELVTSGILSLSQLMQKISLNPSRILGIDKGTLSIGAAADIMIVSADQLWTVEKKNLLSKSRNSAFLGKQLRGVVDYTICSGKIIFKR